MVNPKARRRRHESIAEETQKLMDMFDNDLDDEAMIYKDDAATYSILIKIMTSFMQVRSDLNIRASA